MFSAAKKIPQTGFLIHLEGRLKILSLIFKKIHKIRCSLLDNLFMKTIHRYAP